MAVPVPPSVKRRMKNTNVKPSFLPVPKTRVGTATKFAPSGPLRKRPAPLPARTAPASKKGGFDMNKIQAAAKNRITKKTVGKGAFKGLQKRV